MRSPEASSGDGPRTRAVGMRGFCSSAAASHRISRLPSRRVEPTGIEPTRGEGEDESGPRLAAFARSIGAELAGVELLPDDRELIEQRLRHWGDPRGLRSDSHDRRHGRRPERRHTRGEPSGDRTIGAWDLRSNTCGLPGPHSSLDAIPGKRLNVKLVSLEAPCRGRAFAHLHLDFTFRHVYLHGLGRAAAPQRGSETPTRGVRRAFG